MSRHASNRPLVPTRRCKRIATVVGLTAYMFLMSVVGGIETGGLG